MTDRKAKGMKRSARRRLNEGEATRAWKWKMSVILEACAGCGIHPGEVSGGIHLAHHTIYQQHVKDKGGDLWDTRNSLALCDPCHQRHHSQFKPIPLSALRDENLEFAAELLGPAAYDYLKRRYSGSDSRLDALLEERETDAA